MTLKIRSSIEKCSLKILLFPLIDSWASCSSGLHAKSVVDERRGATVNAEGGFQASDTRDARPERLDQQHFKRWENVTF